MAVNPENYFPGDGSTDTFTITFEYLDEADVKVTVNGAVQNPNAYSFANATTILFSSAPANGAEVRIYRDTDVDELKSTFFAGSSIRAQDLNQNFEQNNFAVQEIKAYTWDNETATVHSNENWVSSDEQIATTAAIDARFFNDTTETIQSGETWANNDTTIATTAAIDDYIDEVITNDIAGADGVSITNDGDGTITIGLDDNSIDFAKIQDNDIITQAEQDASSPAPGDSNIFTASAAARRFDTLVQTGTPTGSAWETGKTWYQNDEDKTVFVWDGSEWDAITSGGAFTRLDQVIYVDATNGNDDNNGHRISTPKKTIKSALAAINSDATYGDGSTILVAPGVYQETAPLDIQKKDVAIIGASVRNVIVHPTAATETNSLFRVNSGSYLQNMTFTGMKASGTRGDTGSLWEDATYGLPPTQGWNVSFYPDAMIYKSPYIQNCTNFSDSEIDNDDLAFYTGDSDKGRAGDLDSAPTGGGLLINGATVHDDSPLRSIVADSYTHVGLDGPGIFVTNNGYCQVTSSYAFFNHFHIACINGGQANLAASTTDFGRYSLVADGRSTSAIFTATTSAEATDGSTTFTIGTPTAGADWHGSATRPQDNMLVDIGGNTYPVLSATANGTGWDVTVLRPNANDRTENLGLDGTVASGSAVSFFLRSMVASSGHTMEYVGSGTNYSALPENGGVPNDDNQVIELNNGVAVNNTSTFGGKVWAAITDHNGTFRVGDTFEVNQQTGFVSIPSGALSVNTLLDTLDTNNNPIQNDSGTSVDINDDLQIQGGNTLLFADDDNSNTIGFTAPSSVTADVTFTLPDGDGNSGEVLSTNGSGTLSWSSSSAVVDRIIEGNTSIIAEDTGTDGSLTFTTEGLTAMTIDSNQNVTINQNLTVDTDTLFVDSTNDQVGIGTTDAGDADLAIVRARDASNYARFSIGQNVDGQGSIGGNHLGLWYGNSNSDRADIFTSAGNMNFWVDGAADGTGQFTFGRTFNTEWMRIDDNGRLLIGGSSNIPLNAINPALQIQGTSSDTSSASFQRYQNNANPPFLYFAKSRGATVGAAGVVNDGDILGEIRFNGDDGTDINNTAASIEAQVDGTPATGSMPGELRFSTNDGTVDANPTIRMIIRADGSVGIGTTAPNTNLHVRNQSTTGFSVADNQDFSGIGIFIGSETASGDGNYGAALAWSKPGNGNVFKTAIAPVQEGADGDVQGLAFFTANGTVATDDPAERVRINADGKLLVGTTTSTGYSNIAAGLLQVVADDGTAHISVARSDSPTGGGSTLSLNRSRGTAASPTIVNDGDTVGDIRFGGHDGTDYATRVAIIEAQVDGTPAENNVPGCLIFSTTATSNPQERFRISPTGGLGIEGTNYGTEGQVLQSRGNDAPTWSDRVQKTAIQDTSTNTNSAYFFTNIPTWANVIIINFHEASLVSSQDIQVRLGSDGDYYNTGYRSNSVNQAGSASAYRTDSFVIDSIGTTASLGGHIILTNLRRRTGSVTGLWSESHSVMNTTTGGGTRQGGGIFENATTNGDINCIRIGNNGSSNFDDGRISITYM